ncbi:hypothetical protein [Peribacillus simplex]|uniref:hypothetical protein n=1 Tax=Peribacillus simplex TaxID=1478 RepID=UPI003335E9B6
MAEVPAGDGKAVGLTGKPVFFYALFVKIVVFKTGVHAEETHRPPRGKRALEGKSTTPHYLVNSNTVCENSLFFHGPYILRKLVQQWKTFQHIYLH